MSSERVPSRSEVTGWSPQQLADYLKRVRPTLIFASSWSFAVVKQLSGLHKLKIFALISLLRLRSVESWLWRANPDWADLDGQLESPKWRKLSQLISYLLVLSHLRAAGKSSTNSFEYYNTHGPQAIHRKNLKKEIGHHSCWSQTKWI